MLTIVMYHYVRDLRRSRYPRIKGLTCERFDGQLDYLQRHYTVVGLGDVVAAARGERPLPPRACMLSFDDGFVDHFTNVFPRLIARGLKAAFHPAVRPLVEERVLDTHKVHFILASVERPEQLVARALALVAPHRGDHDLPSDEDLSAQYAHANRFDPAEIVFIKRLLQCGLPTPVRAEVCRRLFAEIVTEDEAAFARELYMDEEQLTCMARLGMDIGGHGYDHEWLGETPAEHQAWEIAQTTDFLARIHGRPAADWCMCYPFGSFNDDTLRLLQQAGCAIGLTTKVDVVRDLTFPLQLSRLDTTDLPCSGDAALSPWTLEAP